MKSAAKTKILVLATAIAGLISLFQNCGSYKFNRVSNGLVSLPAQESTPLNEVPPPGCVQFDNSNLLACGNVSPNVTGQGEPVGDNGVAPTPSPSMTPPVISGLPTPPTQTPPMPTPPEQNPPGPTPPTIAQSTPTPPIIVLSTPTPAPSPTGNGETTTTAGNSPSPTPGPAPSASRGNIPPEVASLEGLCYMTAGPGKSQRVGVSTVALLSIETGIPQDVCMSANACLNIVNAYLNLTGGSLSGKPGQPPAQPVQYTSFKDKSKSLCPHNPNVQHMTDLEVQAELTKLMSLAQ